MRSGGMSRNRDISIFHASLNNIDVYLHAKQYLGGKGRSAINVLRLLFTVNYQKNMNENVRNVLMWNKPTCIFNTAETASSLSHSSTFVVERRDTYDNRSAFNDARNAQRPA